MVSGVVVPSILALLPFVRISFPILIGLSVVSQIGAFILGLFCWQRTQGKIVACAAATLLILIGTLVMLIVYAHDGGLESLTE